MAGLRENPKNLPYKKLAKAVKSIGYKPVPISVNWYSNLSKQIFKPSKNSVIFGFSLGAILAILVAQKYKTDTLILASMTPRYYFKRKNIKKALIDLTSKDFINDIIANLKIKNKATRQITVYGDREGEKANVVVKRTGHRINNNYVKEIIKIITY